MYYQYNWGRVMKYNVHIYSNFDALIFKDSVFLKETNLKKGLHISIETEQENTFFVYSSQSFVGFKYLPYAININQIIQKNNFKLAKLKNYVGLEQNTCEIVLEANLICDMLCDSLKKITLNYNKKNYYVEVFPSFFKINNVTFYLKHSFNSLSCFVQLVNNFILVVCQNEKNFFVSIFNIKDNLVICEYQNVVDKFELEKETSTVKILSRHNSFYKTGIVTQYSLLDVFEEKEHYFVKMGNINSNLNINLIPFAFMQCVMLKDYNYAKNFLCSELQSKLNSNSLSSYFKDLEDFEKCKYYLDNDCLFVKFKDEVNYKPIKFIMQNNKIVDIK